MERSIAADVKLSGEQFRAVVAQNTDLTAQQYLTLLEQFIADRKAYVDGNGFLQPTQPKQRRR